MTGSFFKRSIVLAVVLSLTGLAGLGAQGLLNASEDALTVYAEADFGTLKVLHHTYQVGTSGTEFDFLVQGGQELLFPYARLGAGVRLGDRHHIGLVYQPLEVTTNVTFREIVTVDGVSFAADTPMILTYSFPFYRLSYSYDFLPELERSLEAGLSLQLRNASIRFVQVDGAQAVTSQNLGLVPALNARYTQDFASGLFVDLELVGIWASSSVINGASFEFEGSLLDAALKVGLPAAFNSQVYASLRFVGGTAKGTSEFDASAWSTSQERYTSNALATLSLALGVRIR